MPKIRFFHPCQNIPTQKTNSRLTNWPEYNPALIQGGSLTWWLDEQTLADWYHQGPQPPGGAYRYCQACIQWALSLKAGLGLAYRQTQGLIQNLLEVMKRHLQTPTYTQLCRRGAQVETAFEPPQAPVTPRQALHLVVDSTGLKVLGEGEWKVRGYGASKRRSWRKRHLALDEASRQVHAVALTSNAISDGAMLPLLLADLSQPIGKVGADGADEQVKVYELLADRQLTPLLPPRSTAVVWTDEAGEELLHCGNETLKVISQVGLVAWKQHSG